MNENHQPRKRFTPQQAKTIVEQLFIQAERLGNEALGKITRSLLATDENLPQTIHIEIAYLCITQLKNNSE